MKISRRAFFAGGSIAAIGFAAVADTFIANVAPFGFRPMLKGLTAPLNFAGLNQVTVANGTIFTAVANTAEFNLHSYIVHFDGQFWCMWSTGAKEEDAEGQNIVFSTSANGVTGWSAPQPLSGAPPTGFRYIARGFWVRDGALIALVSKDEVVSGFGESLELLGLTWTGSAWGTPTQVADDTLNNFPPKLLPNGDWLTSRRDHNADVYFMRGDIGAWQSTLIAEPTGINLSEPTWELLPDKTVRALFRVQVESGWVYEAFSYDYGATFTVARRTNFPDASSKIFFLKLSDGRYVIASNPRQPVLPNRDRTPLTLAVSDNGDVFDRMVIVRQEATTSLYHVTPGYMYPHGIEHDGSLYLVYSRNKEDIQVSKINLADIP